MAVEENDLQNEIPGPGDRRETDNSSVSVERSVIETVIVIEVGDKTCYNGENRDLGLVSSGLGLTKAVAEASDRVEQRSDEDSRNLSVEVLAETRIVISPSEAPIVGEEDNRVLNAKVGDVGLSKVSVEEPKSKTCGAERHSRVIDISCGSAKSCADKWDGESVCRICHLSSDQSPDRRTTGTSVSDLIQLGCGCKDDLGITHYQCAEAWFKLKGNRVCEICGETAKNVTGVGDIRFMEEWNERFSLSGSNPPESSRGCWRGQPFCNFLMACLVIAFVLPWFFRVNMF